MKYLDLDKTSAQQRIQAELIAQLNRPPKRIRQDSSVDHRGRCRRIMFWIIIVGGLFAAPLYGIITQYGHK